MQRDSPAYTAASFQSIPMTHTADEVFSPPMAANRRAEAKACKDPVAYRFFQSHPLATAEGNHAQLYLRLAATDSIRPLGELGAPVTYVWRPDRVERHMRHEHLDFSSVMRIAARSDAVLMDLRLHNGSLSQTAAPDLFLRLLSGVEKLEDTERVEHGGLPAAATRYDDSRRAFVFRGPGGAVAVQGIDQPPRDPRSSVALAEWVSDGDMRGIVSNRVKSPSVYAGFGLAIRLPPGGSWRLRFVHVIGEDERRALARVRRADPRISKRNRRGPSGTGGRKSPQRSRRATAGSPAACRRCEMSRSRSSVRTWRAPPTCCS